jgi:CRISPR-associated endonuclease Csn1
MHKDTVSGLVQLRFKKTVSLSNALDEIEMIVDKPLRKKIKVLINEKYDKKKLLKYFKDLENKWNEVDISKVEIHYLDKENVASRVKLDDSFNAKKIESITDTSIQKILLKHLEHEKYQTAKDENGKSILPETIAFSADGIEELNKNITVLNGGKSHQPIFKVRTFESKGNKFNVGLKGNKKDKFVEAAKGTNLFFAVYQNTEKKRNYDTVQLNIVIERQKQGLSSTPEINEIGDNLLFNLSPNDLVYVPTIEERENPTLVNFEKLSDLQISRVYNVNDFSGVTIYFTPNRFAKNIAQKELDTSFDSKLSKTSEGISIKEICWKLIGNRVGKIIKVIK